MTDIQILQQLLNGYHLETKEIERAEEIVKKLNIYLKQQTKLKQNHYERVQK